MAPSAKLQKFETVFLNKIVPELVQDAKDNNMPKEAVDWYERVRHCLTHFFCAERRLDKVGEEKANEETTPLNTELGPQYRWWKMQQRNVGCRYLPDLDRSGVAIR
jgi:hypothetical protein